MASNRPVTSGMRTVATDLRQEILSIVHGLQHGHGRQCKDGTAVVFRNGVPQAVVQAELSGRDVLRVSDDELGAILDELTTRNLFGSQWLGHHEWPSVEYERPDGRTVSTRIDPECGLREVLLDDDCVAIEFDDRGQPKDSFACYWITEKGLAALDDAREFSPNELKLNGTEELILVTLGDATMKGEKIAKEGSFKYNSNFKTGLSGLVKQKMLTNVSGEGYTATRKGHAARRHVQNTAQD